MNRIVDLFREIENDLINEQRRIRIESPLKVFYGITINKLYRISFISNIKPFALESTKEIKITQGKEKNEVFWTCFDLLNNEAKDVFFVFCDSLIKTVANCKDEIDALNRLREKYYAWRLLLKNKGKIPYEIYQGLFGELYFLNLLASKAGHEKAVLSWVGSEGYSKDFSISNTWYEIKTIGTSSKTIKINSLSQLESNIDGHLIVIVVEKMSDEFEEGLCSVPILYRAILSEIKSHEIREEFVNKLLKYGYYDDENLNKTKFEIKSINSYLVDKKFPKLTRDSIKSRAISNVTYDLDIGVIEQYKEEMR